MRDASLRLAYFARGLDGLFLPPIAGCETFALLRAGSPEADWAGTIVPRAAALVYRLRGHEADPYPSTGDVLRDSDVARVLQRRGISALLLSSSFTLEVRDWAQRHGVRILAADYEDQERLENKLWFDRFLARHQIPRPESAVVVAGEHSALSVLSDAGPVVVQRADSMGGEGTYFLTSLSEWPKVAGDLPLPRGERCLARRFVSGRPLGISVFVAPGLVALSAVRLQCYYPRHGGEDRRLFAGVQWLPAKSLAPHLCGRINAVFQRLGTLLYRRKYFGFANFDFLADSEDQVWVIECNPRMSAATPQLLAQPELSGGVSLGRKLLEGFARPRRWPRAFASSPLPMTDYAGATLDITGQSSTSQPVRREFASRPHSDRAGEVAVYSLASKGQVATSETTLATILADFPLYDARGNLNAAGRRLTAHFRYT